MAFVLDASVTIVWAMRDEEHAVAQFALHALDTERALVPAIWWYEVRNILLVSERRQRISVADSIQFVKDLGNFPIDLDEVWTQAGLTELARLYSLSVYDAAYLELAIRKRIPLATLDKALRSAAEAAGIPLLA
jgi:predicted nucleic acid-binding protein